MALCNCTLDDFRRQLATRESVPAGVSLAAISASLALGLLIKVLEITRNRRTFRGDPKKIDALLSAAQTESTKLADLADQDVAAYAEYIANRKSQEALNKAIEVPLAAARAAAAGLQLCTDAAEFAPESLKPDLGTAALLLSAAIRGILFSVHANGEHAFETPSRCTLKPMNSKYWPKTTSGGEHRPARHPASYSFSVAYVWKRVCIFTCTGGKKKMKTNCWPSYFWPEAPCSQRRTSRLGLGSEATAPDSTRPLRLRRS